MDVPKFSTPVTDLPGGFELAAFTPAAGGPIFDTVISQTNFPVYYVLDGAADVEANHKKPGVPLQVSFLSGLQNLRLDSVHFADEGIITSNKGQLSDHNSQTQGLTRKMSAQISFVMDKFQSGQHPSLPISVRLGPVEETPCCNPERLTLTLNLRCNRHYPFFSLAPDHELLNLTISPHDAIELNLVSGVFEQMGLNSGLIQQLGLSQPHLERKLANALVPVVKFHKEASSVPGLSVFYPHDTVTAVDLLGFLISSNLPITQSDEWEFCPE